MPSSANSREKTRPVSFTNAASSLVQDGAAVPNSPTSSVGQARDIREATSHGAVQLSAAGGDAKYYTVAPGDTLWGIAEAYLGDGSRAAELQGLNRVSDPRALAPRTKLLLPADALEPGGMCVPPAREDSSAPPPPPEPWTAEQLAEYVRGGAVDAVTAAAERVVASRAFHHINWLTAESKLNVSGNLRGMVKSAAWRIASEGLRKVLFVKDVYDIATEIGLGIQASIRELTNDDASTTQRLLEAFRTSLQSVTAASVMWIPFIGDPLADHQRERYSEEQFYTRLTFGLFNGWESGRGIREDGDREHEARIDAAKDAVKSWFR